MCVYLHYNILVVPAVSVETRIMCVYTYVFMYVYYTLVLVPGDPLRSYRGHLN
jgi:hypothetical protein